TAGTLRAEAFTVAEKHAELQALLASYERYLAEHRLADEADVYRAALSDLGTAPIAAGDVRLELPGVIWSPLERQLLDALPGEAAALVWDKATRHGWPVTLSAGVPAALTRPGRALRAFLTWAEEGFPAATLRRLLQSGDVKLDFQDGPSPGQAARLLARAEAT